MSIYKGMSYSILSLILLSMLVILGCSQGSDDSHVKEDFSDLEGFKTYTNDKYGFSMAYPKGWLPQENMMGSIVVFISPVSNKTNQSKNLNLIIQDMSKTPMSLDKFSEFTLGLINKQYKDFELIEDKEIIISGNEGRMIIFKAGGQVKGLKIMQAWTIIDDKTYYFTYMSNEEEFSEGLIPALAMLGSFLLESA